MNSPLSKTLSLLLALLVSSVSLFLSGCLANPTPTEPYSLASIKNAFVVTVGVEQGFAGKCWGAKTDANRMKSTLAKYARKSISLRDKKATRAAVLDALKQGSAYDLFIFYFSGHGGQTAYTQDKTETDGRDEFICCYDTTLSDNDIWNAVSTSKGRVVLIFDCCHSGTMFRFPSPRFSFSRQRSAALAAARDLSPTPTADPASPRASSSISGPINLLCWSACPDEALAWGTSAGGAFTNSLRKHYKKKLSYDQLWAKIEADKSVLKYESAQQTKMGKDFGSSLVFQ